MDRTRNVKDVLSGLLFLALAALFWWQSRDLAPGTAVRMGPGYFPLILCGVMGVLGLIVLVSGLRRPAAAPGEVAWQALAILTMSVLAFGFLLHPLGFLPTLFLVALLSAFASRKASPGQAVLLAAGIAAFCWAIFILGLGLPLSLVGPWLGGY